MGKRVGVVNGGNRFASRIYIMGGLLDSAEIFEEFVLVEGGGTEFVDLFFEGRTCRFVDFELLLATSCQSYR